jgi:hypothetical protein
VFEVFSARSLSREASISSPKKEEFGKAALAVINDPRIRADLLEWRDNIAARSTRTADYAWSVLNTEKMLLVSTWPNSSLGPADQETDALSIISVGYRQIDAKVAQTWG